jgi:ADP-ribosylglycohydrolase
MSKSQTKSKSKDKMSPIIKTADKPFNAEELANKYRKKAHNKIHQKVSEQIKDKKEAEKYTISIIEKTVAKMKEVYALEDPVDTQHYFNINAETDFIDFYFMAYCIPLYQSLGDTIGYRNGIWEFNNKETANATPEYANTMIAEFIHMGGINKLSIVNWRASDDTILYLATYDVLIKKILSIQNYGEDLRKNYVGVWSEMEGRDPGIQTGQSIRILQNPNVKWDGIHYDTSAIGAGAAMRTGCIGIFYPGKSNRKRLIALATEASRITHNSATSILGSICTALFTAYAMEKVPLAHWPHKLMNLLKSNKIDSYVKESRPMDYDSFSQDKIFFKAQWQKYIDFRFSGLVFRTDMPITMQYPVQRMEYLSSNYAHRIPVKGQKQTYITNPGSCADDACIIAYDSLVEAENNLEKLLVYSILHHGDSDTVGSIAFSWFGAYYFSKENYDLAESRFAQLEFYKRINDRSKTALRTKFFKVYYYDLFVHFARKYIKKIPV